MFKRGIIWLLDKIIGFYQYFISPLLGSRCKFYPTCSNYARESISRFGVVRGLILSILRIAKCGPFHAGGYDPVPKKEEKTCENEGNT